MVEPVEHRTGDASVKLYRWSIAVLWLTSATALAEQPKQAPYLDPELAPQRRAADLIARMTLEEKDYVKFIEGQPT